MAAQRKPKAIKSAVDRWFMAQYQRKQRLKHQIKEITRDILNFNGTQYATLSEPVVLDGDFEVEVFAVVLSKGAGGSAKLLDGSGSSDRLDWHFTAANGAFDSRPYFSSHKVDGDETYQFTPDSNIHRFTVARDSSAGHQGSVVVGNIGTRFNYDTGMIDGSIFSIRIWKDGDRNTGELVTDLRFDEPDTIYQRNYASPIADENDPDWSGAILENTLPGDWEEISKKSGDDFWLGVELYTQDVWLNPFTQQDQWTYEPSTDTWLMVGDGSSSVLRLIPLPDQPDVARLIYEVERISGTGTVGLTASDPNYILDDSDFAGDGVAEGTVILPAADLNQLFKRGSGVVTIRVSRPSLRRYLEYAEGAL